MKRFQYIGLLAAVCAAGLVFGCGTQQHKVAKTPASPKDTAHSADSTQHASDSTQQAADTTQRAADMAQTTADTTVKTSFDSLYYSSPLTYEQREGKFIYMKYCDVCHGDQGKGDGFNSYNLDPKPGDLSDAHYTGGLSDDRIVQAIREGGAGVNKSPLMPSWGGRINKEEIGYVVAYLRTFAQDTTGKAQ